MRRRSMEIVTAGCQRAMLMRVDGRVYPGRPGQASTKYNISRVWSKPAHGCVEPSSCFAPITTFTCNLSFLNLAHIISFNSGLHQGWQLAARGSLGQCVRASCLNIYLVGLCGLCKAGIPFGLISFHMPLRF